MAPNLLRELIQTRLSELYSEIRSVKRQIAELKQEGLIAAKGTAIASYKARSGTGDYWEYFKFTDQGNRTLIHIGKEGSIWLELFRQAIQRRNELDALEQQKTRIREEIKQLQSSLKVDIPNLR